jgi:hypothetical protein
MLTLHFDDNPLGACSTLEISHTVERAAWVATLHLHAATPATLAQAVEALQQAAGTQGDLELKAGDDTVRALAVADCRAGPTLVSATAADKQPGEARGQQVVRLRFECTPQDASEVIQSHEARVELRAKTGEPARLIHRGRAVLRRGEDPADHEQALLPGTETGWRRVNARTTREPNVPALEYETTDEQVFHPLPAGVEDGHYAITESGGVRTIKGFFVGPGADARAFELAPLNATRHEVTRNPFQRRVDFEYQEPAVGDAHPMAETLTFTTTRKVIDHPLLSANRPAYRQQVGAPQTEIIQEGASAGHDRHPSPPAPRFAADLIERRVHYSVPHPDAPADQRFVTRWRYVSRSNATVAHTTPNP